MERGLSDNRAELGMDPLSLEVVTLLFALFVLPVHCSVENEGLMWYD